MPVDPRLYELLAEAKARPSKLYRAFDTGFKGVDEGIQGYLKGQAIKDSLRERTLKQQTLSDALGGIPPEEGIMNLTGEQGVIQHPNLAVYAAFEKAKRDRQPKPGDNYTPEQAEAVSSGDPSKLAHAFGGVIPRSAVAANTTSRGVTGRNDFYGTKGSQINLQQLPSEMGPNTGAGAAFGVKIAARQGKSLVATPGSAQKMGLASGDIARAVLRAAPQLDVIRGADFSQNLATRISAIGQKITANPNGPDAPKLRREMYDILDDLDKSATPFIQNHLKNYEELMAPLPEGVKRRESGEDLPDIPFNDGSGSGQDATMVTIRDSQGGLHKIPAANFGKAKQRDPGLQVVQ